MASLADLLKHIKETGETLSKGYPRARGFADALVSNISKNVPSQADFQNPQAMSQWSQAAALNAPMGLTFAGKSAKLAPLDKYNEAEQLIAEKYPHFLTRVPIGSDVWHNINKEIHAKTGIHYSPEGIPRHEISDKQASLFLNGPKFGTQEYTSLFDTLLHSNLYSNYPDLKKMNVSYKAPFTMEGEGGGGYGIYENPFTDETERYLQLNTEKHPRNKETILHEIQHAIQDIEGFERGGNVEEISNYPDLYLNNKQIESIKKLKDFQAIPQFNYDEKRSFIQNKAKDILGDSYNTYKRLAGEAEARASTKRMNMTPEERAASYPYESYDYPVSELLVRSLLRK